MDITLVDSNIVVENEENKSISVQNKDIIVANSEPEFEVTVQRKEYSIVGDGLYIPKRYEDAPQWIRDLIGTVTEESYARKITDLNNLSASLQQLIVELEVAKNTYTQSIISSNDINERINTAITTLNSSLSDSDATIVDLISTRATLDEASTIAWNTISSSINDGEIGALVGSVRYTLSTETETLANNIDLIHAEMSDGFEGIADVIQATQAYVGIDEAGASTGTGLSAYLEDSLGNIGGADSQVANGVYINNGVPTSKFEYTSDLSKNGVHYKSGFGLKTLATGGDGSAANPYDSEFWINAAKFKFTNDNVTGQVAPFTIDATGLTPNITFNGKVSFTNVTNVPVINKTYVQTTQPTSGMNTGDTWIDTDDNNSLYTYNGTSWIKTQSGAKTYLQATAPTAGMIVGDIWVDSDDNYKQYRYNGSSWVVLDYNPATAINAGTTTINGGKITTGSITANQIQANSISADRLNVTSLSAIAANIGTITSGVIYDSTWDGSTYKMKIDLTNGSIYII